MTPVQVGTAPKTDDLRSRRIAAGGREVLGEDQFLSMIARERKRSERSNTPLLLMLLESNDQHKSRRQTTALEQVLHALIPNIRETDIIGWYQGRSTVGVIFTEVSGHDKNAVLATILGKVSETLRSELNPDQFSQIRISFHFFPDDWTGGGSGNASDPALYPDVLTPVSGKVFILGIKRAMDIVGSSLLLIALLPLFLVIAALVKLSSKGPIFFRQQRVGQYGRPFSFLKFRSMQANNDASVHQRYVAQLIAGTAERIDTNGGGAVYKLANDTRVTPVGKFLRRSSMDELPQLINVLRGEMSLVGPRPPIPYELETYQTWHRRRLLQVKPGITGLWQVKGRSRVTFDEMVRLDLQYATTWSPWLDVRILLQTPAAVLKGAY